MTDAERESYRRVPETCTAVDLAFFLAFGDAGNASPAVQACRAAVKVETGRMRTALTEACARIAELEAQSPRPCTTCQGTGVDDEWNGCSYSPPCEACDGKGSLWKWSKITEYND